MLGVLNIHMVMLSCVGDLLEDSAWNIALFNTGITAPGNDAVLTGHAVAKSQYMHQITKSLHVPCTSLWHAPTPNGLNQILPKVHQVLKCEKQVWSRKGWWFPHNGHFFDVLWLFKKTFVDLLILAVFL